MILQILCLPLKISHRCLKAMESSWTSIIIHSSLPAWTRVEELKTLLTPTLLILNSQMLANLDFNTMVSNINDPECLIRDKGLKYISQNALVTYNLILPYINGKWEDIRNRKGYSLYLHRAPKKLKAEREREMTTDSSHKFFYWKSPAQGLVIITTRSNKLIEAKWNFKLRWFAQ